MDKRPKQKFIPLATLEPVTVRRNTPPALYLREELVEGTAGKRTVKVSLPMPPLCLVFEVNDDGGKGQYVIDLEELISHVGQIRDLELKTKEKLYAEDEA